LSRSGAAIDGAKISHKLNTNAQVLSAVVRQRNGNLILAEPKVTTMLMAIYSGRKRQQYS
jgi:hypothetical protein